MFDVAHTTKILTKLRFVVVDYFVEKHGDQFPGGTLWEKLVQMLPPLQTEVELSKLERVVEEVFLDNLLKQNLAIETLPPSLIVRLDALYCKQFCGFARTQTEPYLAFLAIT